MEQNKQEDIPHPVHDHQFYKKILEKKISSWIIDTCLALLVAMIIVVVTLGLTFKLYGLFFIVASIVLRYLWVRTKSATIGMRFMGIVFRNSDGEKLTDSEALLHATGSTIMSIPLMIPINAICSIFSARRCSLVDLLLKTVIINKPLH